MFFIPFLMLMRRKFLCSWAFNGSLSGCQNCRVLLSRNIISLSVAPVVLFCKPRVCGEKASVVNELFCHQGSPPRMRGKGIQRDQHEPQHGITPAYAGKSHGGMQRCRLRWDHPRVCGEKCWPLVCTIWLIGSPPRMRGKVGRPAGPAPHIGITPAYAGKRVLFCGP